MHLEMVTQPDRQFDRLREQLESGERDVIETDAALFLAPGSGARSGDLEDF